MFPGYSCYPLSPCQECIEQDDDELIVAEDDMMIVIQQNLPYNIHTDEHLSFIKGSKIRDYLSQIHSKSSEIDYK